MNGFIKRTTLGLCLAGGLVAGAGCFQYRDLVDPCYPERYEFAARKAVHEGIAPQVQNGHILDQTIWNWMFYPGTDRLHPAGIDHLTYLIRRRPAPDPVLYLATAQDIGYDAAAPEKFADAREDLDKRRVRAIEQYVSAATAKRGMTFKVEVHDPSETTLPGEGMRRATTAWYGIFQGTIGSVGPSTTSGTAGGLGLSGNISGPGTGAGGR